MSGVFGVVDINNRADLSTLLDRMGRTMTHRSWYQVDTFCEENTGIGLGRVGIGIFNSESQPVVSEDSSVLLFMAGEFYNYADTRHKLEKNGYLFRDSSHAEFALRLYQNQGPDFINSVEGIFAIALWDRSRHQLYLVNDRFGFKPLYYSQLNGKLLFSPELKGILAEPNFPKQLNLTALAEYMRFQQLLGEKTFFEDITFLPPASVLTMDCKTGQLARRTYWDGRGIRLLENKLDNRELGEEGERLLRRAVNSPLEKSSRPGIFLTGGLDSRTILAVINPEGRPITTITYGHPDSRDVYLAARLARAAGTRHHFFELGDGNWVKQVVDLHLNLTEGAHSWIHAHGLSVLPQARELIDINLSGMVGPIGPLLAARPAIVHAPDQEALLNELFHFYNQQHSWPGLTEAEAWHLFTDQYRSILPLAHHSIETELARFSHLDLRLQGLFFNLFNHDRRMIFNYIIFNNSHFENRLPFYDYQFSEWTASLPVEQKIGKQVHQAIIERAAPKLAFIPRDKDYRLPTNNRFVRNLHAAYDRIVHSLGQQFGLNYSGRRTLYADYENYLRCELRDWAEAILFDPRTLDRGIFRPEALRSLMDRHLAGHEQWTIGKIAPLITFEMMMRRFFDETPKNSEEEL